MTSPDGRWTVRPEHEDDVRVVDEVVAAAFGGPQVPELLWALREEWCWLDLSYVVEPADEPGTVVGHVSYTRAFVDAPDRLVDVLVLSPLSIRPDHQRQGAGRALVLTTLSRLADRPEPLVLLEGDPAYYSRLGFVPATGLGLTRPSVRIPEPAFQAWPLPSYDASVTGALVYPDVFWRHDAVGLREDPLAR